VWIGSTWTVHGAACGSSPAKARLSLRRMVVMRDASLPSNAPDFARVMWQFLPNSFARFLAQIFHANCGLLAAFLAILHRHL
jgi:hypothetical protein